MDENKFIYCWNNYRLYFNKIKQQFRLEKGKIFFYSDVIRKK